jgi:serine/threonine protein kinase
MSTPARQLLGLRLKGGWEVVELVARGPAQTGGHFSQGYIVKGNDGRKAYLKALDYSEALRTPDPARALEALTAAYNFERDILNLCRSKRLDRVAVSIDDGAIVVEPGNEVAVVQYLIFDLADGDLRAAMAQADHLHVAWALRSLHNVATGLMQLHGQGIAHQDVKPSNVFFFGSSQYSKVGDLGRSASKSLTSPHEELPVAGDLTYAPPELLYRSVSNEWTERRLGCDLYLLGSLASFLFFEIGVTPAILARLDPGFHWRTWQGTYGEVLPHVIDAFDKVLDGFAQSLKAGVPEELVTIVRRLCNPDPRRRGHPKNVVQSGNQFALERFVAQFDLLARRAEFGVRRALR